MEDIEYRLRADRRPSATFALAVSVVVHALLVFTLYQVYNELAGPPQPTLKIVSRAPALRSVPSPTFEVDPPEAVAAESVPKVVARSLALPRAPAPLVDTEFAGRNAPIVTTARATGEATLPVTPIELPEAMTASAVEPATSPTIAPAVTSREDVNTIDLLSPRLAALPDEGSSARRRGDFAVLPSDEQRSTPGERQPTDAFAHRHRIGNLAPKNVAAVELGLVYLARIQLDDGSWRFDNLRGTVDPTAELSLAGDRAAATGLALLAFLGAGHDHVDGRYRDVVRDGIQSLVQIQRRHGEFVAAGEAPAEPVARFFSHGIATLALCEACGMTGDPQLRAPAQRALDYLAGAENPGIDGWRYLPGPDCDASVVGWQLAALRCGQSAGLSVRRETMARIGECLANESGDATSPVDSAEGKTTTSSVTSTAVELAVKLHLGTAHGDVRSQSAAKELHTHPPELGDDLEAGQDSVGEQPQRDTYYWYYGSQAMYHLGGDDWRAWSGQLFPKLIQSQVRAGSLAGSWEPPRHALSPSSGYGGRLYVTAMNLLSLETPNRQLPLGSSATPRTAERPR